jgi:hypothetical protein
MLVIDPQATPTPTPDVNGSPGTKYGLSSKGHRNRFSCTNSAENEHWNTHIFLPEPARSFTGTVTGMLRTSAMSIVVTATKTGYVVDGSTIQPSTTSTPEAAPEQTALLPSAHKRSEVENDDDDDAKDDDGDDDNEDEDGVGEGYENEGQKKEAEARSPRIKIRQLLIPYPHLPPILPDEPTVCINATTTTETTTAISTFLAFATTTTTETATQWKTGRARRTRTVTSTVPTTVWNTTTKRYTESRTESRTETQVLTQILTSTDTAISTTTLTLRLLPTP